MYISFRPKQTISSGRIYYGKALTGVTNTNEVFDISPDGKRLLGQLNVIHKTYDQLLALGHKPKL